MSRLTLRGICKRFGQARALHGIDLDVAAGGRTAVIGPSGSGKTTLLRLIAGFEVPDDGEIALDGDRVAGPGAAVPAHRRSIGLVMQEGALFPHLSVLDNIAFGLLREPGGRVAAEARARELLGLVGLDRSMAARAPHTLSGGQQQRVALARALARRPRLLLLDEPFSALDTALRAQVREATMAILDAARVTALLVTHDGDEAMGFADQIVVLREGRLVQAGPPRELYLAPADAETAALLGPAILLDAVVRSGRADTVLGAFPLAAGQSSAAGRARILLRPEQLRLRPAEDDGSTTCVLQSVSYRGQVACLTLRPSAAVDAEPVRLELPMADVPTAGTRLALGTAWPAHRLPPGP